MSDLDFEQLLTGQLRDYARGGVRPIDAVAVATATLARGRTRAGLRWPSVPRRRWPALVVLGLLLLAFAGAVVAVGSRLLAPAPAVLLTSPSPTSSIAPAPTGRIAFVKGGKDTNDDIWVVNADGSGLAQLTSGASPEHDPAWSPDATRIAFLVGDSAAQIWVMDADGSNKRQLTHGPFPAGPPTWSPDGSRIAFGQAPANIADARVGGLYVIDADGSGQTEVTANVDDLYPAWSPAGDRIAFVNGGAIFTIRPNGSGRTLYAAHEDPSLRFGGRLSWAPDGSRIAAEVAAEDPQVDGPHAIWLEEGSSGQGSSGRDLTIDTGLTASSPTWSGDGQWIAFAGEAPVPGLNSSHSHVADIYAIRIDGSGLVKVTTDAITAAGPDWSWTASSAVPLPRSFQGLLVPAPDLPKPLAWPVVVTLADGRVLICENYSGAAGVPVVFDPTTGAYTSTGPMVTSDPAISAATLLRDGRVLLVGDSRPPDSAAKGIAEVFDPRTLGFTAVGPMVTPRTEAHWRCCPTAGSWSRAARHPATSTPRSPRPRSSIRRPARSRQPARCARRGSSMR